MSLPSRVTFFKSARTRSFFKKDADGYVASLTPSDLIARKAASPKHYLERIMDACCEFSRDQKESLGAACVQVDQVLAHHPGLKESCESYGVLTNVLRDIPWKLALTRNKNNEDGYPHTRKDIIFLSTNFFYNDFKDQCRTLLHEKIHLYQRKFPKSCQAALLQNGYRVILMHADPKDHKVDLNLRSNPDLDSYVYVAPNREIYACAYASHNPKSIVDVIYAGPSLIEHPFEKIAYEVADIAYPP